MNHVVGISEFKVSEDVNDTLITYSLGSCLGLVLYDPIARIGGMVHCLLPLSKTDSEKAKQNPAMFTDTGVLALLNAVLKAGADKHRLLVKAAGCSCTMDKNGRFKVGDRNLAVLRKILWKNNMMIDGEDVGGTKPRTLRLCISNGETTISTSGVVTKL